MARTTTGRKSEPPSSERSIHFFRINSGTDDGGRPKPLDLRPSLNAINALGFAESSGGRYWPRPDDERVYALVDEAKNMPLRVRLIRSRRNALPRSEQAGQLKSLQLPVAAGIAEVTHIAIFENGIVGAEFNFFGPRALALPQYIDHTTGAAQPTFTLEPLLQQDVADRLRRHRSLRMLDLQIRPSFIETLQQLDGRTGEAFAAAYAASEAEIVGLILRPRPHGRASLPRRLLDVAINLAERRDLRENASNFDVKGVRADTGKVERLDVLQDKFIASRKIVRIGPRSRALKADAAYAAIEEAYRELRPGLEEAASIGEHPHAAG